MRNCLSQTNALGGAISGRLYPLLASSVRISDTGALTVYFELGYRKFLKQTIDKDKCPLMYYALTQSTTARSKAKAYFRRTNNGLVFVETTTYDGTIIRCYNGMSEVATTPDLLDFI